MSVRGVGRGGKAGAPQGTGGAAKASGGFGAKVDRSERLVGPSGAAGTSNVAGSASTERVMAQVMELARQVREGQLKSRDAATKSLVANILREKVRLQSRRLTDRIFDHLKDDPRLSQTLERLWKEADEESAELERKKKEAGEGTSENEEKE